MITHSDKITKLMGAMLKVQGAVDGVAKTATNPHFKKTYASLESVVDAIREPCQAAGLVVMQAPGAFKDGAIAVETMIAHAESGEWIRSTLELPLEKTGPQGAGSAITYAERYSLMALFNLPPVDDDGNDASRRPEPPQDTSRSIQRSIPNPNILTTFDKLAEAMGYAVRKCGSVDALEALREDPKFKADFKNLPPALQATVGEVIKTMRAQFERAA